MCFEVGIATGVVVVVVVVVVAAEVVVFVGIVPMAVGSTISWIC